MIYQTPSLMPETDEPGYVRIRFSSVLHFAINVRLDYEFRDDPFAFKSQLPAPVKRQAKIPYTNSTPNPAGWWWDDGIFAFSPENCTTDKHRPHRAST